MMVAQYVHCLLIFVVVPLVCGMPLNHDIDRGPLAAVSDRNSAVSELNSRVVSRLGLLQNDREYRDPRLPLPSAQELETIKKVAQVLIMLGEQVLPSIFGEPPSKPTPVCASPQEIPNDNVTE